MQRDPLSPRPRAARCRARAAAALASILCFAACSSIENDLDLSPFVRNLEHPHSRFEDGDFLGPIVPFVEERGLRFYGVRPFFTVENRAWAESSGADRETVVSFIAPFGKYHSNPRTTQWRFSPLLWSTSTTTAPGHEDYDFIFFPILWFGSSTIDDSIRGIGERDDTYFALFPLAGRINTFLGYDRIEFLGWPILQRLYKRVFREEPEESLTSVILFIGWTQGVPRGGSWHALPFYSQSLWTYPPNQAPYYPPGADPNEPLPRYRKYIYGWPFVHWQENDLDRGPGKETFLFAVWPFFKHEWSYDHEFWTILWPFFRVNKEWPYMRESHRAKKASEKAGEDDHAAFERGLAMSEEEAKSDENTNVLYDVMTQAVYRYVRTGEYWRQRILLLLWAEYHTLPETKKDSRIDSWAVFQPIGFWKRDAWEREYGMDGKTLLAYHDRSYYLLAPFYMTLNRYYLDEAGEETGKVDYFTKLWPLFSYEKNADGSADIHSFSLLPLRVERFVKDFNDAWLPFVNLYRYRRFADRDGGGEQHSALFTLVKWYRDDHENTVSIPAIYTGRTLNIDGTRHYTHRFLFGMFGVEGEESLDGAPKRRAMRLFWIPVPLGGSSLPETNR